MGCGASTDKPKDGSRRGSRAAGDAENGGAEARYAESASPVPSEVEALLDELDRRTPSHSSAANEPSEAVRAIRFKAVVTRGKVVNGMNEDPDQFKDQLDVPEFKRRDRRRVDEWVKLVAAATGADGPEPLPEEGFYMVPSFSVAFTQSSSTMQPNDGRPLDPPPMAKQRSSGGTHTGEFVDDPTDTESFSVRKENSSIDHIESGEGISPGPSGEYESARAALAKQQQLRQESTVPIVHQEHSSDLNVVGAEVES